MRKWYPIAVIVIAYAAGIVVFTRLPSRVATHFDIYGAPDGWSSRWVGAFLLPTVTLVTWPLMRWLPRIDPRRANYEKFQATYDMVVNLVLTMMLATHLLVLATALGAPVRIERAVPVIVGVMLVILGNVLPRARSNWMFGIRTPWTLSNDRVWERTHRVGGYLLMGAGIVAIGSALFAPLLGTFVMVGAIAAASLGSVAYSYVVWREEQKGGQSAGQP